jgi:hypothetical protein
MYSWGPLQYFSNQEFVDKTWTNPTHWNIIKHYNEFEHIEQHVKVVNNIDATPSPSQHEALVRSFSLCDVDRVEVHPTI